MNSTLLKETILVQTAKVTWKQLYFVYMWHNPDNYVVSSLLEKHLAEETIRRQILVARLALFFKQQSFQDSQVFLIQVDWQLQVGSVCLVLWKQTSILLLHIHIDSQRYVFLGILLASLLQPPSLLKSLLVAVRDHAVVVAEAVQLAVALDDPLVLAALARVPTSHTKEVLLLLVLHNWLMLFSVHGVPFG